MLLNNTLVYWLLHILFGYYNEMSVWGTTFLARKQRLQIKKHE